MEAFISSDFNLESDIYALAQTVIEKCGNEYDPKEYALFRSDRLLKEGDDDAAAIWVNIAKAIDDILNGKPKGKAH